jgi:transposase
MMGESANAKLVNESPEPDFAALVGIDWGDREHVWCLQVKGSTQYEKGKLKNQPEAMAIWMSELCQRFPQQAIAVAIEKCRGAVILMLSRYEQLHLYPIAPQAAACFRQALHPSGATDDSRDAAALLEMLSQHREHLQRWTPDDELTRLVQGLVEERRRLVNEKTRVVNRLTAKLKMYFPQILEWVDVDSKLGVALLQKWSTLEALQKAGAARLRTFFRKHHCRQAELIETRIRAIGRAVVLLRDRAVIQAQTAAVQVLVQLLSILQDGIAELEQQIEQAVKDHPDFAIFDSFPGAGAVLGPRLLAAFGSRRERYATAAEIQSLSGIAPVREQSGKKSWVHFRRGCPKFLRQSFHEWAGCSIPHCGWARAYYEKQRARKKDHQAAVRALAFKWIRIAFRCWKDRVVYDEQRYLASLAKRGSALSSAVACEKPV